VDPTDEAKEGIVNNDIIDTTTTKTSKRSVSSATARFATVGMAGLLLLGGAAVGAPAMAAGAAPVGDASAAVAGSQHGKRQVSLKAPRSATTGTKVTLKGKVKKNRHHKTRVLIQKKHGKKWTKLDSTKTNKKGTFRTSDVLTGKKKVTLRAKAKGHGTSATQTVKLTKATNGNNTPATPATPAQPAAPQQQPAAPQPQPPAVVKQDPKISWGRHGIEHLVGDMVTVNSSSGTAIHLTSSNGGEVTGNKVRLTNAGDTTITATVDGNANWNSASVSRTFTVDGCLVSNGSHVVYKGDGKGDPVKGSPNTSLQEAVNKANPGDTLTLQGTCSGNPDAAGGSANSGLGIGKALTIKGEATNGNRAALITQKTGSGSLSNVVGIGKGVNVTFTGALDINGFEKGTTNDSQQELSPVDAGGVMYVDEDADVTIGNDVKLTGGYAKNGGSIYNKGAIDLSGTVTGGYATNGGSIYNLGTLDLKGTVVNGYANQGGGIYNNDGTVTLNGGTISGNQAKFEGGGIYNNGGTVTLNGGTIGADKKEDANRSVESGGGIYLRGGSVDLNSGGTITGNHTGSFGGGICISSGTVSVNGQEQEGSQLPQDGKIVGFVFGNTAHGSGTGSNIHFPKA
jgi:hypothetical protein